MATTGFNLWVFSCFPTAIENWVRKVPKAKKISEGVANLNVYLCCEPSSLNRSWSHDNKGLGFHNYLKDWRWEKRKLKKMRVRVLRCWRLKFWNKEEIWKKRKSRRLVMSYLVCCTHLVKKGKLVLVYTIKNKKYYTHIGVLMWYMWYIMIRIEISNFKITVK